MALRSSEQLQSLASLLKEGLEVLEPHRHLVASAMLQHLPLKIHRSGDL